MPFKKSGKGLLIVSVVTVGLLLGVRQSLPKTFPVTISYPAVFQENPSLVRTEEKEYLTPQVQGTVVVFPLDINSALAKELEEIPGIGPVTASRIVEYKEVLGGYTSLEQLQEIKGIGEQTYLEISAYLVLND